MALFPSAEWVQVAVDKLNADQRYAQIAKNWEGDIRKRCGSTWICGMGNAAMGC
jgi:hypothetical protein